MEISDNVNADLNSSSVTTTSFESMEVDEVLISSSDIFDNKCRNKCCCAISRILQVVLVTTILNENNQLDKNDTYDKNGTLPSVEPTIKVIEMTENATLPPSSRICENEECTLSANRLIQLMDLTMDPCENFYQFSCGGWEKMLIDSSPTKTFADIGQINSFNHMDMVIKRDVLALFQEDNKIYNENGAFQKAKTLYQSCMNTDAIKEAGKAPLIQLLNSYGGWPIIKPYWDERDFNWKKASSSLLMQLGIHVFFNISSTVDLDNTDKTIFFVTSSYVPDKPIDKMKHFISDRLSPRLGWDLIDLEIFLLELNSIPTLDVPDFNRSSIKSLPNLQELTDSSHEIMNWTEYLNSIFSIFNFTVRKNERVMADVTYLRELFQLLNQTSPRTIANYVHWKIVENTIEDTEEGLNLDRETFCFDKMRLMEPAIISKYVNKFFPRDHKREIMQLVSNLKSTFLKTFYDEEDMSLQISSMKELVGYPDWIVNETLLTSYYQELNLIDDGTYFQNIFNVKRFSVVNYFKKFFLWRRNMEDEEKLLMASPNAYYINNFNTMIIPLSVLRPPFYWKGGLMASNYGSIGSTIGHEMGHGIVAAKLKRGRNASWEGTEAKNIFDQIVCFIRQYSNYTIKELHKTLDGKKTYDDNIADFFGVTQAFKAYQNYVTLNGVESRLPGLEQFNPEQIFFISYATKYCTKYASIKELNRTILNDEHTVAPYRIIGALSNSEEFAHHFKCPLNSRMNPAHKCNIH